MRDHVATLLDDFRRYGSEVAVVRYQGVRRRVTTYGQIASMAGRFAAFLAQRGISEGDRVILWGENSAEWIAAFHGCLLRGVLAVPLDANGTADFAARVAADVSPSLALGDMLLVDQLPTGIPRMSFEDWPSALPAQQAGAIANLNADTPLEILFTSGTTGDPKGIVLTHGNVLASFEPIEKASRPYLRYERLVHPLRILHTLPLSHVFGQTMGLWVPSVYRAELHFESRLVASRLVETIRRERISVLAAVPRVHSLLRSYLESAIPGLGERIAAEGSRPSTPSRGTIEKAINAARRWHRFRDVHRIFGLKFWALISGGGALPAALETFWNAVGLVVIQGYGMTESTALITLNHPFRVAQGTIGKPLAGREVKLGPDGEVLVRGASISTATWSGGTLHPRTTEWLATGDLAQTEPTGELRFLGRKSEVIVTAAGVNLHPEDLEAAIGEAAIEREARMTAVAVVPVETGNGPEPVAVLALRGKGDQAAGVIEQANRNLAEFQRLRRWVIWPEPDLPRTSTGKIRRKAVVAGLARLGPDWTGNGFHRSGNGKPMASDLRSDWLLAFIAQISGETSAPGGDELRLTEDLHLDSLGRVQLAAAIEERFGIPTESGALENVETLGQLRRLLGSQAAAAAQQDLEVLVPAMSSSNGHGFTGRHADRPSADSYRWPHGLGGSLLADRWPEERESEYATPPATTTKHLYPHWPWWTSVRWLRTVFIETVMRPLVALLASPKIVGAVPSDSEPMLIVANHVTTFDEPLLAYALPPAIRQRIAVAMSGEMLADYRHFRNADRGAAQAKFFLPGPAIYFLLTALFNVFPLPRLRDFQRSFAHAGEALDRGMHVVLFPEGTRSAAGKLAPFRPGVGLLVKQSSAPVLPVAIRGLGELKASRRGWFRSGVIEVHLGKPMRFLPTETEAQITARLHAAVDNLLSS